MDVPSSQHRHEWVDDSSPFFLNGPAKNSNLVMESLVFFTSVARYRRARYFTLPTFGQKHSFSVSSELF